MKPFYNKEYIKEGTTHFRYLRANVDWVNRDAPRDECFMAPNSLEYTYGESIKRTYTAVPLDGVVKFIMDKLNSEFDTDYICFLNYYKSEKEHLGWHADDSPEMDTNHPIAVISFSAERDIWVKKMGAKGVTPADDRYPLSNGSLFVMPAHFQESNLHKIPKGDRKCDGRISLTFRRYTDGS